MCNITVSNVCFAVIVSSYYHYYLNIFLHLNNMVRVQKPFQQSLSQPKVNISDVLADTVY